MSNFSYMQGPHQANNTMDDDGNPIQNNILSFNDIDHTRMLGYNRFMEVCHYFLKNFTVDGEATYKEGLKLNIGKFLVSGLPSWFKMNDITSSIPFPPSPSPIPLPPPGRHRRLHRLRAHHPQQGSLRRFTESPLLSEEATQRVFTSVRESGAGVVLD